MEIVRYRPESHAALVPELTKLLHAAYAPLAAAGMNYLASRQPVEKTGERLQEGESYLFFFENQLVGTVTLTEGVKKRISAEYYQRPGLYVFNQFAIRPGFQGRGWGHRAMDFLEGRAKEKGASELALDTAETAAALIRMYQGRGYRIVSSTQWPDVVYRSVIMAKEL